MYCLLNLMSESGIDAYRTASVLGYCILPLVLLSMFSVVLSLECVPLSPFFLSRPELTQGPLSLAAACSATSCRV